VKGARWIAGKNPPLQDQMESVINLKKTWVTFASMLCMVVLMYAGDMKGVHAASSERKVHVPVVEEISEFTDEELLQLQQEANKPKPDSGRFTRGILWKIEKHFHNFNL